MAGPAFLTKTPVEVRFGEQEQKGGSLLRLTGQLASAIDVAQAKRGAYKQRNGKTSVSTTTDSGTISTARGLCGVNGGTILQTADSVYSRGNSASTWRNKGSLVNAFMSWKEIIPLTGTRPTCVSTGGNTWWFLYNRDGTWKYQVTEDASGAVVVSLRTVSGFTEAENIGWGKPVVAGGFVWLIASNASTANVIKALKFNPASPTSAPVVTTYTNFAGMIMTGFDVMQTSSGFPLVMIWGTTGSNVHLSYLDHATGLPKASPGVVTFSGGQNRAGCILRGADGSGGTFYVAVNYTLYSVNASTLVATLDTSFTGPAGNTTPTTTAAACGWVDGSGNKTYLYSNFSDKLGPTLDIENAATYKFLKPSGAAVVSIFCRSRYVVTPPFQVSGTWYIITAHDDTANLQRAYYLQDLATGLILARTLYQLGGDLAGRGKFVNATGSAPLDYSWVGADPIVSGSQVTFAALANLQGTNDFQTVSVTCEIGATAGPIQQTPGTSEARIAGGWPMRASIDSPFNEQSPAMYPRGVATTSGTVPAFPAGSFQACAVYATVDASGNVTRSSPSALLSFSGGTAIAFTIPTNRTVNSNDGNYIELYITQAGGVDPFLVRTVANDPTVDRITMDGMASVTFGELLYTSGGVLSNIAPPPHRASCFWKNRHWLFDTDVAGEIWASKEIEPGFGVGFSDSQIVRIAGRNRAGGAIDANYLAVFQSDRAYVLFGDGQSDTGGGQNFKSLPVNDAPGCTNAASVVSGPGGCYYQGQDGGIYVIGGDLRAVYVGAGVDDYRSATVTAAIHVPKARHVRFFLDSGKCLVLDYGNTESNPLGKWYVWTNHAAVAASVVNDVASFLGSDGVVWQETEGKAFDATNTPILWDITLATLSLGGLNGYQRTYRGHMIGEFKGNHTIQVTVTADGTAQAPVSKALTTGPEVVEFKPSVSKCSQIDIRVQRTGTDLTDSCWLEGLTLEVGIKPGSRHGNVSQRMT
jgi:hypothetical protein